MNKCFVPFDNVHGGKSYEQLLNLWYGNIQELKKTEKKLLYDNNILH